MGVLSKIVITQVLSREVLTTGIHTYHSTRNHYFGMVMAPNIAYYFHLRVVPYHQCKSRILSQQQSHIHTITTTEGCTPLPVANYTNNSLDDINFNATEASLHE